MPSQTARRANPHPASKLSTLASIVGLLAVAGCGGSSSGTTTSRSTPAGAAVTPTTSTTTTAAPAPSNPAPIPKRRPTTPSKTTKATTTSSTATSRTPRASTPRAGSSKPKRARPVAPRASSPAKRKPSTSAPKPVGETLSLQADPAGRLRFNEAALSAKGGQVSIDFTNKAPLAHNMTIASSSGSVVGATPTFRGGSKALTLKLKPGTYRFYCSVPGHRTAGMEGTLTVK